MQHQYIRWTGDYLSKETITTPEPGPVDEFLEYLQSKLDEHLENNNPPDAPILTDILKV